MKRDENDHNPYLRDPDVRLMLRAKAGDDVAFSELVATYQDRLIGVLTHLLQNREAAEDLAQEVFMRIYRARCSYEPTARFSTWMFQIANNLARNLRRDTGRRREVLLDGDDSGLNSPRPAQRTIADKSGLMPARLSEKSEMCSVVRAALETLTEPQRMAVLLHKFDEMSYADIATALDMSPSAVKSLLSRARETLREKLEPYVQRGVLGRIDPSARKQPLTPV
ncbi:MAG: RNA polymerase sigma factor [Deltaproteobacteria bacterium]